MILTFKKIEFKNKIIAGIKIHTIRSDIKNRWKVGRVIHFWLGNPRNIRNKIKPHQFAIGKVTRIETIKMCFYNGQQSDIVYIGDDIVLKSIDELNALSQNDGFDNWYQMKLWFDNKDKQFSGKIIFWNHNNLKYYENNKI